jgi:acyl carrier protein
MRSCMNETYLRVASVVAETLDVDADELNARTNLLGDLSADSLDLLDVLFRLEKEFGLSIEREDIFPTAIFDARVKEREAVLRDAYPFYTEPIPEDPRELVTVGFISRFIGYRLSAKGGVTA